MTEVFLRFSVVIIVNMTRPNSGSDEGVLAGEPGNLTIIRTKTDSHPHPGGASNSQTLRLVLDGKRPI